MSLLRHFMANSQSLSNKSELQSTTAVWKFHGGKKLLPELRKGNLIWVKYSQGRLIAFKEFSF